MAKVQLITAAATMQQDVYSCDDWKARLQPVFAQTSASKVWRQVMTHIDPEKWAGMVQRQEALDQVIFKARHLDFKYEASRVESRSVHSSIKEYIDRLLKGEVSRVALPDLKWPSYRSFAKGTATMEECERDQALKEGELRKALMGISTEEGRKSALTAK